MMMADNSFEDGVGKLSCVLFSGKEEDFTYFQEQFEARMYCLKMLDVMERRVTEKEMEQKLREGTNQEGRNKAKEKAESMMKDKRRMIWCELVQALDKTNVLYLRSYKGDGPKASEVLQAKYKSYERPRLQQLIEKLTSLRKLPSENITEYICRAEACQ